jgi:aminoglycoside phosphotransferase (APT) family kinase protein
MVHTHDLMFADSHVVKRYTSWERGEHLREWSVLQRVDQHAPDLAPRPIAADLESVPPAITMSAIPGTPLTKAITGSQADGLIAAITALWNVPHEGITGVAPWTDALDFARQLTAGPRPTSGVTATAYDAAKAWWHGPDPQLLKRPPRTKVLGHRDPNLDNYLWDGHQIRIVDFEDAAISDPAMEFAILLEHLSWRDIDCGHLLKLLTVDDRRLLAARRLWAMFWLSLLLPGGPAAGRNPAGAADQQAHRLLELLRQ